MLTKLALALFAAVAACNVASATPPVCLPPCTSLQRCVQISSPPGQLLPPKCVPK
jgi:hypothetical protein